MDIVVNVNIGSGEAEPSVDINKKTDRKPMKKGKGGIIEFPEGQGRQGEAILDFMGIKET